MQSIQATIAENPSGMCESCAISRECQIRNRLSVKYHIEPSDVSLYRCKNHTPQSKTG